MPCRASSAPPWMPCSAAGTTPRQWPRSAWRREVKQAYDFFRNSDLQTDFPSQEGVALYYERRAPEEWPVPKAEKPGRDPPLSFRRKDYRGPAESVPTAVSNVNLVHLFDERRLDVLACEMRRGQVLRSCTCTHARKKTVRRRRIRPRSAGSCRPSGKAAMPW